MTQAAFSSPPASNTPPPTAIYPNAAKMVKPVQQMKTEKRNNHSWGTKVLITNQELLSRGREETRQGRDD
jgi:hypothetical protein